MSDNSADPSGTTEQFRAFVHRQLPRSEAGSRLPLVAWASAAALVVLLLVVVGVLVW